MVWVFPDPNFKKCRIWKSNQNSKTEILSQRISDSIAAWEKSIYYNMIWNNTLAMNAVINHKKKILYVSCQSLVNHTDKDTKLLYCAMFLLRMSEQGPRTRSNRALSSLTHFNGPRATTVAARGLSNNKAISPETEWKHRMKLSALVQNEMRKRNRNKQDASGWKHFCTFST